MFLREYFLLKANRQGPHRLVVRTSRCGRDNPGSTPGAVMLAGNAHCTHCKSIVSIDLGCSSSIASSRHAVIVQQRLLQVPLHTRFALYGK